jgi:flagellar motility protein MotE (MotC chaperone)
MRSQIDRAEIEEIAKEYVQRALTGTKSELEQATKAINSTIGTFKEDILDAQKWIGILKIIGTIAMTASLIVANAYFSNANIIHSDTNEIRQQQLKLAEQLASYTERVSHIEEAIKDTNRTLKEHNDGIAKAGEGIAELRPYLQLYAPPAVRANPNRPHRKSSQARRHRHEAAD